MIRETECFLVWDLRDLCIHAFVTPSVLNPRSLYDSSNKVDD